MASDISKWEAVPSISCSQCRGLMHGDLRSDTHGKAALKSDMACSSPAAARALALASRPRLRQCRSRPTPSPRRHRSGRAPRSIGPKAASGVRHVVDDLHDLGEVKQLGQLAELTRTPLVRAMLRIQPIECLVRIARGIVIPEHGLRQKAFAEGLDALFEGFDLRGREEGQAATGCERGEVGR
eukprot:scaffold141986_cov29-Tisochrysis_lutea.AAC.11